MDSARKALAVALVVLGIAVPLSFVPTASAHQMSRFNSYADLVSFVQSTPSTCGSSTVYGSPGPRIQGPVPSGFGTLTASVGGGPDYSATNIQVQGVDELDTVKTDGQYIYAITNNSLVIVKAYPVTGAGVVSRITPNGTLTGVFVSGDRLILVGRTLSSGPYVLMGASAATTYLLPSRYSPTTRLWVYDISDRSSPTHVFTLQENGSYVGSRLIANSVYLITTENIIIRNSTVDLPSRIVNGQVRMTPATQIYHSDVRDYAYSFTTVARIDFARSIGLSSETFLISTSSTIYVSTGNIYLTSTIWTCQQETVIHRVSISNGDVRYEATGTVLGTVMNQFSMDEYNEFLRVATTSWPGIRPLMMGVRSTSFSVAPTPGPGTPVPAISSSSLQGLTTNVYVLDMGLQQVGRLERLSAGEQFHSARFMGDRGYLVTFKKTDPLFVIDLHNPHEPRVLGELYVSGYSAYLQPYDETHLIGIGKNATDAAAGTFAWYQGVKVSLFDVSDPTNPVEVSSYVIGDRGTQSPALCHHHAVLFDRDRNLLVIPVEVAQLPQNNTSPWTWGSYVWQGAYVFKVSPEGGIVFKGGVTHLQGGETPSYSNNNRFIERSLFINDVLYTVSPAMIKMNNLEDLSEIGLVSL